MFIVYDDGIVMKKAKKDHQNPMLTPLRDFRTND
jgi:hypothetical protein